MKFFVTDRHNCTRTAGQSGETAGGRAVLGRVQPGNVILALISRDRVRMVSREWYRGLVVVVVVILY